MWVFVVLMVMVCCVGVCVGEWLFVCDWVIVRLMDVVVVNCCVVFMNVLVLCGLLVFLVWCSRVVMWVSILLLVMVLKLVEGCDRLVWFIIVW